MRQQKPYEAYLDDYDKVIVYMSKTSYDGASNSFFLKNTRGSIYELHIQTIETTQNNYNKYTLGLYESIEIGDEYYVEHQHARQVILEYAGIVKTTAFDEQFYYDAADLGFTYTEEQTSFALWAPTAFRVKIEICKNNVTYTYEMQRTHKGVFRFSLLENLENATYVYFVRVNGKWNETIDPYGCASIENTKRSAIIDKQKIHIREYPLAEMQSACDAIIYEVNIRDFTIQNGIGVEHQGKFLGFVEENDVTKTRCTGFTYLKSLGITHVQLMPVMDFGSVDELYPFMHYNWGYDPVQYRCLEGSYSVEPTNPYDRMMAFTKLIEECHKAGIRVNLDVVFNHMYDKEESTFDKVVPNYYFQMNEHGDFSNGTYCGNDIDSKRKMCRKYIVESCLFLVKMYQIDGLRFDLMGILDVDTMNEIRQRCFAFNPDFMVYGEGWDMPSYLEHSERACISNQGKMPYIAHFSDRFRDVVKGRTNTNEVNVKGYCTGAVYLLDIMKNCLGASCLPQGMDALFAQPVNVVNYVECHDNMTSWDKLKECCKEDSKEVCIAKHKMMIAAVLVAQGIPFLHSGQEFARTKHGLANTYEENDEINQIDYFRRDHYLDIVNSTKALIAIRKAHRGFRYMTSEALAQYVSFEDIERKVLLYKIKDEEEDIVVIFNPSGEQFTYEFQEPYSLLYDNGKTEDILIKKVNINPYSTIIFAR